MLMDEKIDHGSIIAESKTQIADLNYEQLHNELAEQGAELLLKNLPDYIAGKIKPVPQDDAKVTFTKIIKKSDGKIDWSKPAEYIERQIRAFHPWPGTYTIWDNKSLKIIKAEILEVDSRKEIGSIFLTEWRDLAVQTGQNCLILQELQLEGKKPSSSKEFLHGHNKIINSILK